MYLYTPDDTYMYSFLPSAFRIRRRFGRRVAHGVPFDDPGSASMALEASTFSCTLLFLGRAVGGIRAVRAEKTRPHTWPEPFPWLLPGYGVDEPETGIEGGDWCQTRPMGLTKGGLPPFSRLPGTLVRLPVEMRSKTALILCPLPGVAYKEGTVGTSQRVPAPTRAAGCGHHDHE